VLAAIAVETEERYALSLRGRETNKKNRDIESSREKWGSGVSHPPRESLPTG
jgi:hypothetical protein